MIKNKLLKFRKEIKELNVSLLDIVEKLEANIESPSDGLPLNNFELLSDTIKRKRKATGISFEDLALQTNLSISTLKRLFADPSGARFSNVVLVLHELGIKSWAEK